MAIFGAVAAREGELRRQSTTDAEALFREHGAAAVALLTERLIDTGLSADERRLVRLTRLEIERLMRTQRRGSTALVIYRPKRFTIESLARFFGLGGRSAGKRSRRRR